MYWDYWTAQLDRTIVPWTAEIGNLADYSYFNAPSLWFTMQSQFTPYQMPDYSMNFQQAYNNGANMMRQLNFASSISTTSNSISQFKSQIESLINSDNISEDRKALFKEMLEQIKLLEEQMKLIQKMAPQGNIDELQQKINDINKNLSDLKNIATEIIQAEEEEVKKAAEEAKKEAADSADKTDKTDETDKTDKTDESDKTDKADKTDKTDKTDESDKTDKTDKTSETDKTPEHQAQDICKDIYIAIKGWGTDEKKFDEAIFKINENNVIEVMDKWQRDYIESGLISDDSFLESLFDDVGTGIYIGKAKRIEYTRKILKALEQAAEKKGVDVSNFSAVVENELSSWWTDYDDIDKAIKNMWLKLTDNDKESKVDIAA